MFAKISISIPKELLAKIEVERTTASQSRSEFFAQLVEAYLKKKREEELDEQYRRGYELYPETEEEIAEAEVLAAASLKAIYEQEQEAAE
ncbi:MAG: ribbon-helix-helix protein, CopG family [Chloroflexi bacterium]|nr:ribbon-helix-helix protein, CopG family [Chloroflexota bacterium]